jgi:autotransporter-associated beta strand protein
MKNMKKLITLVSAIVAGLALDVSGAPGDTYVWTGNGADGKWMNPANWGLNGSPAAQAPGVPYTEVTTVGKVDTISAAGQQRLGEKVEFGALANGNTTIDLEGLYCIRQITVKAGAPAYTFGTSSEQVLPLEAPPNLDSAGKFALESGLENMPVLAATFGMGAAIQTSDAYLEVENNASGTLVFNDLGKIRVVADRTWGFTCISLRGTGGGGYRFAGAHVQGDAKYKSGLNVTITVPKITVASTLLDGVRFLFFSCSNANLEILEGATLAYGSLNGNYIYAASSASITGAGTLRFRGSPTASGTNRARIYANTGAVLEIAAVFEMDGLYQGVEPNVNIYGNNNTQAGTVLMTGVNNAKGAITFVDGDRTFKTDRPGTYGFGICDNVNFYANGTLSAAFATAETLSKTLSVSNGYMAAVANSGTAALTVSPTVTPLGNNASISLCMKAETSPITLTPTLNKAGGQTVGLVIDGTEAVRPTADGLAGFDSIRLCGGILDVSAIANWSPTAPVTFDTGVSTITVPNGETYVLASLARTAGKTTGTLNLLCGTGRVKIDGAAAGAAPAGVLVNGQPAEIRDGGIIAPAAPATDVQIAAKGSTVPNAPTQSVGITTEGSGGNDTIAAAATAVKELVHIVGAEATIEIGADRNLTAEKVTLAGFAGNLNIGVSGDLGTFGPVGGTVQLRNGDLMSDLAIRAKLAQDTRVVVDGSFGVPTVAGGSAGASSAVVCDGTLKVTGERTFTLDFIAAGTNRAVATVDPATWPTVRFDGARNVILGLRGLHAGYAFLTNGYSEIKRRGRIVVTNSLIRSADIDRSTYPGDDSGIAGEENAIVVGNRCSGYMEIQAGAVITNRLVVGAPRSGHRGLGAVYQTGGEMAALGQYGDEYYQYGSGIGCCHGYGSGYYALAGGRLAALGPFSVGLWGFGCLHQTGGELVVRAHPSDTAVNPKKNFFIASGNGGFAIVRLSGGTADFDGMIAMSGGYYAIADSYAAFTVDGTAQADLHDNAIRLINTGASPLALPHESFVNINGQARLRTAGFYDYSKTTADADPANRFTAVGFNGGTLVAGANNAMLFHNYSPNTPGNLAYSVNQVIVYRNGAVIDTDGKTGNVVDVPLTGAFGGGVSAIPWTPPADGKASFQMPPWIWISGDGTGATAVVKWDCKALKVTGIEITSAGVGYTHATAHIRIGSVTAVGHDDMYYAQVECGITPNANTGSFTKKGGGDLRLLAANTYGGDTVLRGGTLKVEAAGAIPADSAVVFAGGGLTLGDGIAAPTSYAVDYNETTNGAVTVSGDYDFTGTTITVRNIPAEGLADRATLLQFTGTITGIPATIAESPLPPGYRLSWGANRLSLSKKGLIILCK